MNNIIEFQIPIMKYKFSQISIWVDWGKTSKGEQLKKQTAAIAIKDTDLNVEVVHPITDFVMNKWKNHSYNTQRKHAGNIAKFLNYLLSNRKRLEIESLKDLEIKHGNEYLNTLANEGKAKQTIKDIEMTLTNFYYYLSQKGILGHIDPITFKKVKNEWNNTYFESVFDPIYPSHNSKKVIEHMLPPSYIPLLLEVAIQIARPIALGILLQLMGGLRSGEVINITRTGFRKRITDGDIAIKLQKRSFRTDIKETSGANSVKKERTQRIFQPYDWLDILYRQHITLYKPIDGQSLFVNRDSKAMSGRSYRQYFDNVKRTFIKILRDSKIPQAVVLGNHLRLAKWSTHISRGTFTNLLAEEATNPLAVAFMRGDSQLVSSLTYMSTTDRMRNKIILKLEKMHSGYVPSLIERSEDNG